MLAKVFVRRGLGTEDTDTSAMLPNFANVATNEEAGNVFRKFDAGKEIGICALDGRSTWVFLGLAETTNGLVLLIANIIAAVGHLGRVHARTLLWLVVLAALASAAKEGVVKVFEGLRRQRGAWRRLARGGLVDGAR